MLCEKYYGLWRGQSGSRVITKVAAVVILLRNDGGMDECVCVEKTGKGQISNTFWKEEHCSS